jgi:hypothetical protein
MRRCTLTHLPMKLAKGYPLALLIVLAWTMPARGDVFPSEDVIVDPTPDHFSVCHEYGCRQVDTVALPPQQWQTIVQLFRTPANTPAQERAQIRQAIAQMETFAGALTGTSGDKGGDLKGLGLPGQMDCIDESVNTMTYLRLLARDGLLKWHTVEDRATRGWFIRGWPHTAAVIRDTNDNRDYVVDSWFLDNGKPPYILLLQEWRAGWEPPAGEKSTETAPASAPQAAPSRPDDNSADLPNQANHKSSKIKTPKRKKPRRSPLASSLPTPPRNP